MNPVNTFELPEVLPPKTAMALFEFFEALTNTVWEKYEADLVQLCYEEHIHDCYLEESLRLENSYSSEEACDENCDCDCACCDYMPF